MQFEYINISQIDEISGGDVDFKKELIDIFLEQIPEFISNLSTFFKDNNWVLLAREAHTAKSSALTFGMNEAGSLLKKIQFNAETEEIDFLPELLKTVTMQLEAAVAELHTLKANL